METFVSFELAKELKEKGFKEQCLAYYSKDTEFYYNTSYGSDVESAFKSFNSRPNLLCGKRVDAPIISQVLKWLREKHATHIEITLGIDGWYFEIIQYKYYKKEYDCKLKTISFINDSYEKAAIAGIEYVLNNLI